MSVRRILVAIGLVLGAWVTTVAVAERAAEAKQFRYVGPHPIAGDNGGGFCYIEGPHVHVYEPSHPDVLYRQHDGGYHFVGDPVPYGYDGPKHAFYGPHPVPVHVVDGPDEDDYCFLEGPHYHYFTPVAGARFVMKGGVYFYAGDMPSVYVEARPRFARINAIYRPLRYSRPVFVEAPPPEYHGPVVEVVGPSAVVAAPVVVAPVGGAVVAAPGFYAGVEVNVPMPVVEVHTPGVYVTRPAVIVERPVRRVEVIEVDRVKYKYRHDNGKHKGHWK